MVAFSLPHIFDSTVSFKAAHAGNIGNERADQLAKDSMQHGQPYSLIKLPKPNIKGLLRKSMLEEWQTLWKNGDTGRKIYNIMPSVSLRPSNWIRDDVIFFSQHGPFPAYLKRFHLFDSDFCICGGIGTACHGVYLHSVLAYEEASAKLRTRMVVRSRQ
ncbi:hypothetical protein AVEN_49258-1 [Araneus ventricosus]|uniref:RNase H type-1 domain-containing protein n=1 Tax=Araneus ventricosus TaxID=182803 RepID=A0A4Y2PIZ9_ARAVE|nr:hypothetical protein AVEN_49258-1 [Araneus ventricosus]